MENSQKITATCLFILTLIALAVVLTMSKHILIPFTLSIFITLIYSPFIHYIEKKVKLPKLVILGGSFSLFIILFLLMTYFVGNSIESFINGADQYKDKITEFSVKGTQIANQFGLDISSDNVKKLSQNIPIGKFIKSISGSMLGVLSNTFLVLFFTLFLLTSDNTGAPPNRTLEEIKNSAGKYIRTKFITSGFTAILTYITLVIFKVEMAFMFALMTFLLNFIPNIGSIVAVLLPLPIALLQYGLGYQFVLTFILLISVQTAIGNVLEPKMMGESMGLHPVTILFFLTFWGSIWGVTGMFLSVPITATLKIIFEKFEFTKPIALIFSGRLA